MKIISIYFLAFLISIVTYASEYSLRKDGAYCKSLNIEGLNYREMTCEQKFIDFSPIREEQSTNLQELSQTIFQQNQLAILEETIQAELMLRAKLTFGRAINSLAPFAKKSAIEFALARNSCSKKTEFAGIFNSLDQEFLSKTPVGLEGEKLEYSSEESIKNIIEQAIEYHLRIDIKEEESTSIDLAVKNPLLSYIPKNGIGFNTFGKMALDRLCAAKGLNCLRLRQEVKRSNNLESSEQYQILKTHLVAHQDAWAKNYIQSTSEEYWKSYWHRVQGICEASHCAILKEDLQTTELLINSLESDWTRLNAEKLACWCDIDGDKEDELAVAKLITTPAALGLGITCIFTGGGACVAGAIAGATAGAVGVLDLNQSYENYKITLNEAQRQSLVSLREEIATQSASDLLEARDELESAALWSGFGLTTGGVSSIVNTKRLIQTLRQAREVPVSATDNAHSMLINKLDTGELNRSPIVALSDSKRGELWMMNLARLPGDDAPRAATNLTQSYWSHVAGVYKKRLNLSDDEVDSFIESSQAMQSRTLLLVNRVEGEDAQEIIGGVAAVSSRNADELLPLEKALDYRLPREEGESVIEIVRLTADRVRPEMARELIEEITHAARSVSNPSKAYIYTSRVHARLYKRLGFPMKEVTRANDGRDVVMQVDLSTI